MSIFDKVKVKAQELLGRAEQVYGESHGDAAATAAGEANQIEAEAEEAALERKDGHRRRRRTRRRPLTDARRTAHRPGRLPRRGPGLVAAVGRAPLGGHARRRRPVPRTRTGPSAAGTSGRSRPRSAPARGGGAVIAVERGFALEDPDGAAHPARPGVDRPVGPDERGRLRPRRPVLVRVDGLRQASGGRGPLPPRPGRVGAPDAGRRHHLQRPGVEPRRIARLLRRHRDRPGRRLRLRPGRRADRPAAVRRAGRRRAPGRPDRRRRGRGVGGAERRRGRAPLHARRRPGRGRGAADGAGHGLHVRRARPRPAVRHHVARGAWRRTTTRSPARCSGPTSA